LVLLSIATVRLTAATLAVSDAAELRNALALAQAGDLILLAEGVHDVADGGFITQRAGVSGRPITLRGEGTGATLRWTANADRACFNIRHSHYRIENLTIDANGHSKRGILIEDADHGKLTLVTVIKTNNEAFKIRNNSQYWLLDRCTARDIGMAGQFGEGFYCGDADQNWANAPHPDETGYITFLHCRAIRTMADGFDFKEGTHHIRVLDCLVDFQGRDVDTVYGNNAVFTRANGVQIVRLDARNNTHPQATGEGVLASFRVGTGGILYGSGLEMKAVQVSNWRRHLYWTAQPDAVLYSDWTLTAAAALKNPGSPRTATLRDPALFTETTWAGIGGLTYPADWRDASIGNTLPDGEAREEEGVLVLTGGGTDFWGAADTGHFAWREFSGNEFRLIAHVTALDAARPWAKAGLMARESLDPDAANVALVVTPGNGIRFQRRATNGGNTEDSHASGLTAPVWLMLARSGDHFTAWHSPDGRDWQQVGGAVEIPLANELHTGLCLSSAEQETSATARFEVADLRPPTGPAILNFKVSGNDLHLLLDAPAAANLTLEGCDDLQNWLPATPVPTPPYPREWSEPLGPAPRFLRPATGP
jgi:regulation of enolase protein 1 (concanavalin A-like superfamily)